MEANFDNLCIRTSKEESDSLLAVADMIASGAIYQSQKDFNYYKMNIISSDIMVCDRWAKTWVKQKGLSFKWVFNQKWKKVD